jgi:hypothetical protein
MGIGVLWCPQMLGRKMKIKNNEKIHFLKIIGRVLRTNIESEFVFSKFGDLKFTLWSKEWWGIKLLKVN